MPNIAAKLPPNAALAPDKTCVEGVGQSEGELILRDGVAIYPRELEAVLMTHPAVAQAAVIGVPHETHGEEVKAVLSLKPGQCSTSAEIGAWCQERMASYKYPRIVEIVAALPVTATGQVLEREPRAAAG